MASKDSLDNNAIFIYVTAPNTDEAQSLAKTLVKEKLVACANVLSPMTSFFSWEGEISEEKEVPLLLKTEKRLFSSIEKRILDLHSYDTPCIVAFPITQGHSAFLNWIGTAVES